MPHLKQRRGLLFVGLLLFALSLLAIVASRRVDDLVSGYALLFLLAMFSSATFVLPGPSAIGAGIGGAQMNPIIVGLVMGTGSAAGELPAFWLARRIPPAEFSGRWFSLVQDWMARRARITILALAAIPNPLYDIGAIIAATARMPTRWFVATTWIGKIIRFSLVAFVARALAVALGWA